MGAGYTQGLVLGLPLFGSPNHQTIEATSSIFKACIRARPAWTLCGHWPFVGLAVHLAHGCCLRCAEAEISRVSPPNALLLLLAFVVPAGRILCWAEARQGATSSH